MAQLLVVLGILGFCLFIYTVAEKEADARNRLETGCAETDLKVYVGGHVNKTLPIYDCSEKEPKR
jgi:hypothetical protein